MKRSSVLSSNLKEYQKLRGLSLVEFSKELDIPKSTLVSILKDGNMTLDTLIRISQNTGIGLDMLVFDRNFPEKLFILNHMEKCIPWAAALSGEDREKVASLIAEIWTVIDRR